MTRYVMVELEGRWLWRPVKIVGRKSERTKRRVGPGNKVVAKTIVLRAHFR